MATIDKKTAFLAALSSATFVAEERKEAKAAEAAEASLKKSLASKEARENFLQKMEEVKKAAEAAKRKKIKEIGHMLADSEKEFVQESVFFTFLDAAKAAPLSKTERKSLGEEAVEIDSESARLRNIAGRAKNLWTDAWKLSGGRPDEKECQYPALAFAYLKGDGWTQTAISRFNRKHSSASSEGKASQKPTPKKK